MTSPQHYQLAEELVTTAAGVMDYDHGLYSSMSTQERLQRRAALTAEAQVHATLALAPVTRDRLIAALQSPAVTGTLDMLAEQGGNAGDLADAILDALFATRGAS